MLNDDKFYIHFLYCHHKSIRGHNALSTFLGRIIPFTIYILPSKTCIESEYFPSAFEQEDISWGSPYKGRACIKLCSIIPLQQNMGSVDEPMARDILLNFTGDVQVCLLDGHIFCMFSAMFLVACEYHTASRPK